MQRAFTTLSWSMSYEHYARACLDKLGHHKFVDHGTSHNDILEFLGDAVLYLGILTIEITLGSSSRKCKALLNREQLLTENETLQKLFGSRIRVSEIAMDDDKSASAEALARAQRSCDAVAGCFNFPIFRIMTSVHSKVNQDRAKADADALEAVVGAAFLGEDGFAGALNLILRIFQDNYEAGSSLSEAQCRSWTPACAGPQRCGGNLADLFRTVQNIEDALGFESSDCERAKWPDDARCVLESLSHKKEKRLAHIGVRALRLCVTRFLFMKRRTIPGAEVKQFHYLLRSVCGRNALEFFAHSLFKTCDLAFLYSFVGYEFVIRGYCWQEASFFEHLAKRLVEHYLEEALRWCPGTPYDSLGQPWIEPDGEMPVYCDSVEYELKYQAKLPFDESDDDAQADQVDPAEADANADDVVLEYDDQQEARHDEELFASGSVAVAAGGIFRIDLQK